MAADTSHQMYALNVDVLPATLPATINIGIERQTVQSGIGTIKGENAASIYPESAYINARRPAFTVASRQMTKCIDSFGSTGLCITSDATNLGVSLYGRKQDCAGTAPGSVHTKYLFKRGVIIPGGLTVDHQGNVELTYNIHAATDGANAALIITHANALPAVAVDTGRWTMATAKIGGVSFDGKVQVSLDFGTTPTLIDADSDLEPTFAGVMAHAPVWRIRGIHISEALSLSGVRALHANSEFVFRKRETADATAEHIQAKFSGLAYEADLFDANGNATGNKETVIECIQEGANSPIIWDTTFVIPP